MRKKALLLVIALISTFISEAQTPHVSAYQAGAYQAGVMNVRDLAPVPGGGLIIIDYSFWNNSTSYVDRFGNDITHFELEYDGAKTEIDLTQQISGYTNVPVLFYASSFKLLGATYMASINPSFISSGYKMNMHASLSDTTVITAGNTGGFGDLAIMPVGLGWSFQDKVDFSLFYTFYAPTGRYETGAADNVGRGYWTHQIQLPTYFYLMEKATALFVMPTFETNSNVKDSDVRPGSRFSIEYGISQYLTSWLELEILNGHNLQISDDSGDDVWWQDTNLEVRDQASTVSFGAGVWPLEGQLNLRLKYAMDYGVRQRYKSNFLSFSVIYIPGLFTGE
jgi:hypothetical protein